MICKKMGIDPLTKKLNLGYIPLEVEPKRQSYILDDEDVFVYLTSVDREQRRSILHVEDIQELQIVQITEQLSRVGESSCSRDYSERESGYGEEENVGTSLEHDEHPQKKQKRSRL
uniref:MULE transposase N-terminal all-beta domain-containing protein n=1 Tax=Brassica oleracea var. oleracea TaxID=109376 RepID=A0A0D3BUZ5_BRAOL